jgi:ABC-type polysaccharide/polyol phosphate export permease
LNKDINKTIYAGWTLAKRSIKLQIRQHFLGYAWVLILPIIYAICFILIKQDLFGSSDRDGTHVLRAFTGITLLQLWMQIVQGLSELVSKQKNMLAGLNIGSTPFALAIVLEGVIALLIRTVLIFAALPILSIELPRELVSWLAFFSSLIALMFTSTAIGLLLAPWSTLYADVRKALSSITLPLLLISPVFYPATRNTDSWLYWMNCFNPVASPFAVISDVFNRSNPSLYLVPMAVWACIALVLIIWSLKQLKIQIPILLERIGS